MKFFKSFDAVCINVGAVEELMRQSETISDSQFDEWSTFGLQIDLKADEMGFTFELYSITISACISSAHSVYNQMGHSST